MDENKYIHVLDVDGKRITSIVIDVLTTKEKALEQAKSIAPNCVYIEGGDDMLDEFLSGKIYKEGKFVAPTVVEPTALEIKKAAVEGIKSKYNATFSDYETALIRARLAGNDTLIAKLQELYKADLMNMTSEIKGV